MTPMRGAALAAMIALAGCNALGGIQPDLATAAKNAAASCVRVESLVMGKAVVTMANDTKGAIQNGSIFIDPETCAMTITNTMQTKVGPVTTTTTGTSSATTVIKAAP